MTTWAEWNFYESELDIVARLKAAIQSGPGAWARIVGTRDDLDTVTEDQQVTPGVYVIYQGFQVVDAKEQRATLRHRWAVVLSVSLAGAKGRESSPRNQVAGKFLPAILQALHGYTPLGATTPLIPITPPAARPSGRFSYYPLAFTSDTNYSTKQGPSIAPLRR